MEGKDPALIKGFGFRISGVVVSITRILHARVFVQGVWALNLNPKP